MKTQQNVTVYKCDFCKKKLFRKNAMETHEKWCTYNPENQMKCIGCEHLEVNTFSWSNVHHESTLESKCFRCSAKDIEVYPISALKKNLPTKYPHDFEGKVLMPKECDSYKCDLPF